MSRLPHRRGTLALLAALLTTVPLASACGTGQNAETKRENFAVGAVGAVGTLRLRNIQLHPASGSDVVDGSALLTLAVYNQGQEPVRLTRITTLSGGDIRPVAPTSSPSPSVGPSATESPSVSPTPSDSGSASPSASESPTASASASASEPATGSSASASASSVPGPTDTSAPAVPAGGLPLTIPPGGGLRVDPLGITALELTGLDQGIRVGRTIELVFQFEPGGTTRIPVPVTLLTGTTAIVYEPSLEPTSYPPEHIDPSWYEAPFDEVEEGGGGSGGGQGSH